ncbi:diguanylate cyclase [Photobacterium damselae]|uniref:GGDEF domain-containing protein n=1 Tax=Photobacterium damselae TaxID=38293 RepID=UPI0025430201
MEHLETFYAEIIKQWGHAHSLRTLCELTCRNLEQSFGILACELVVSYKNSWTSLVVMDETGIHYHFPPQDLQNDGAIPFYRINKSLRQNTPVRHVQDNELYISLPLERRSRIIGCFIMKFDLATSSALEASSFAPLAALLSAEVHASFVSESMIDELWGRRTAERELQITQDEQKELMEQLQALHDLSYMLWRAESMDAMLFTAVEQSKKLLHIDRLAIFLFDDKYRMHGTYGSDLQGKTVDEHYFESEIPDLWFTSHTLAKREYTAIQEHTELYHDLKQVGYGWSGYIALWDDDTPVGWIACDNLVTGSPLRQYHNHIFQQLGFIISQHIVRRQAEEELMKLNKELEQRVHERTTELEQVNQQLEKMSRQDPLTQVANRRVFDNTFDEEWRRAERHQLPISLLIIDVDHFKHYNDCFGHAAGDACLRKIAKALNTIERRAGALFARYGGEEFVLLLPGQELSAATYTAKRVIHEVHKLALPTNKTAEYGDIKDVVTVSIGVHCQIPHAATSMEEFFRQTDIALYEAKSRGRDQYFVI